MIEHALTNFCRLRTSAGRPVDTRDLEARRNPKKDCRSLYLVDSSLEGQAYAHTGPGFRRCRKGVPLGFGSDGRLLLGLHENPFG